MSNIYIKAFSLQVVKESSIKIDSGIGRTVSSPETVHRVMIEGLRMDQEPDELMVLLTLDTKNQITGIFEVSRGTLSASIVHPRDIFKRALLQNAAGVIFLYQPGRRAASRVSASRACSHRRRRPDPAARCATPSSGAAAAARPCAVAFPARPRPPAPSPPASQKSHRAAARS